MTVSNVTRQCLLGHLALQHLAMLLNAAALQQAGQVLQAGTPLANWEAYHITGGAEPASSKQHALLRSWLAPRQQALLYMVGQSRLLPIPFRMSVLISVLLVLWTLILSLTYCGAPKQVLQSCKCQAFVSWHAARPSQIHASAQRSTHVHACAGQSSTS